MKLKRNITATALALSLVAGVALAATTNTDTRGPGNGSGYGMMNGQGPHHGFGGAGWHGKGMRGNNQDCLNGNGGSGRGMGQKGMFRGAGMSPENQESRNAFMEATKDLRKQLHDKQFAFVEAQRNPALTQGELQKQGDELYTLRQELRNKRQEMFKTQSAE